MHVNTRYSLILEIVRDVLTPGAPVVTSPLVLILLSCSPMIVEESKSTRLMYPSHGTRRRAW